MEGIVAMIGLIVIVTAMAAMSHNKSYKKVREFTQLQREMYENAERSIRTTRDG